HFENAMHERLKRDLRLLKTDVGFEAPVRCHPTQPAASVLESVRVWRHLGLHHNGNENLRRPSHFHPVKTGLCDSDNSHRVTIEVDRWADDAAVPIEVAPPEAVAEYHDRPAVGNRVVVRRYGAAQCCPHAQYREVRAGDQLRGNLRRSIASANGDSGWEPAEHS